MLRHLLCLAVIVLCVPHASAEPIAFEYRYHMPGDTTPIQGDRSFLEFRHNSQPQTLTGDLGVPIPLRPMAYGRRGEAPIGTVHLQDAYRYEMTIFHNIGCTQVNGDTYAGSYLSGTMNNSTYSDGKVAFIDGVVRVGDYLFRIRYDSFDVPSWDALVNPVVVNGDITVTQVPEPTTLALATLGVAGCWWVRRRGSRPASRESLPS